MMFCEACVHAKLRKLPADLMFNDVEWEVYCEQDRKRRPRVAFAPQPADCPLRQAKFYDPLHYWRTREGLVLKISDMANSHLLNCIRMVEEKNPEFELWMEFQEPAETPALDQMAASLSDWESDNNPFAQEAKLKKIRIPDSTMIAFRQYQYLLQEAEKRGLLNNEMQV